MNIKEILFWIFLIISLILLIWNVFGNSPSEFVALIAIVFTVLIKMWAISDRQLKLEMRFNALSNNIKDSFDKIKDDVSLLKKKLKI